MNGSTASMFQQILKDAERHGAVFANCVKAAFPDDEIELGFFVDALINFYYLMDSDQFFDLLDILHEVFDVPMRADNELYKADMDKADAYIPFFLEAILYAILDMDGDGV